MKTGGVRRDSCAGDEFSSRRGFALAKGPLTSGFAFAGSFFGGVTTILGEGLFVGVSTFGAGPFAGSSVAGFGGGSWAAELLGAGCDDGVGCIPTTEVGDDSRSVRVG